jgi:hypothetical protein
MKALLNLHHSIKIAPHPFPSIKLVKTPIRADALAFGICVLYYCSPWTRLPITTEKTSKHGVFSSTFGEYEYVTDLNLAPFTLKLS